MKLLLLLALLWVVPARAEATRYVLAPAIIQSDPAPRVFRTERELAMLSEVFQKAFEKTFPGGNVPLSLEHPLDPDEPTVLVAPRLSAVRLNLDTVAGTLERYEAMIVGDITVMDPWTMTRLFSATRMVTRTVELSANRSDDEKIDFIRKAFRQAVEVWLQECLAEIQKSAHPFTLKATILAKPGVSLGGGGGIWPYGSAQGLKASSMIQGPKGRTARVRELFEKFCVVEDPANPGRTLKADESYRVTLVGSDTPAERGEPRMAIRWVGPPAGSPAETGDALDEDGWVGLMANYLSKDGRFRILPGSSEKDAGAWTRMADKLRTFSLRANAMATQDITALQAAEDPEFVVEIGLLNAYHGRAAGENGGTDHTFRAQWGVRWFEWDAERKVLVFKGAEFLPEQKAVRTKPGLRELDLASVWFNLCRNGIIHAAEKVGKRLRPAERLQFGQGQRSGEILWAGAPPPATARITRRRSAGRVEADGVFLGNYWGKPQTLAPQERRQAQAGDQLQYDPGSCGVLAGLLPVDIAEAPMPLSSPWIQARLAALLGKALNVDLVLGEPATVSCPQWLRLKVDTPTLEPQGNALKLGAAWRLRLYRGGYDPAAEPAFKLGLMHSVPVPMEPGLRPADLGTASQAFQAVALEELMKRALGQGLAPALSQGD